MASKRRPDETGTRGVTRRDFLAGSGAALTGALAAGAFARGAAAEVDPAVYARAEAAGFPEPKYVETNGIRMAVFEQGEGFPVVFSHGFPELAYSWRHQLPVLAGCGFRAIAPDQRGYGRTQRPEAIEDYDIHHLCGDLAGLLDALEIERAVFCGHDWGGMVVWQMAHLHPDRVAGVIGVNTPYSPRSPMNPIDALRAMRGEDNYIVAFQEPGKADAILDANTEKMFRMFMRHGGLFDAEEFAKLPVDAPERKFQILKMLEGDEYFGDLILSEDDLAYYVSTFKDTGFTGGINWYRNIERNWSTTEGQPAKIDKPCLYVGAADDVVLPPSMAAGMGQFIPDLEKHVIQDCGHWTQQEHPDELNTILVGWLTKRFKANAT